MSFDVWLENRTPFEAATHVQMNADGQEVLVAMFSASFCALAQNHELQVADEQLAVAYADVHYGDPAQSSVRYDADIAPVKPLADVIVIGSAHAPNGVPVREMQVGLRFGALRKVLHVVGDRIRDAAGLSAPHPFRTMPIVYERAYGGSLPDGRAELRNPVGIGFTGGPSPDPAVRTQAPNVTYPGDPALSPSDKPRPAGFGVVARGWRPRIGYAGTYDKAWLASQWPLPPRDMDPRHHLCAPEDQQLQRITGGEPVTLIGMTPGGRLDFRLPRVVAPIKLIYDDHVEEKAFVPDTVIVEPDLCRVTLKARLSMITRRNAPALRQIVFGHVTPAFLLARRKRKDYFSPRGGNGTLRDKPVWQP